MAATIHETIDQGYDFIRLYAFSETANGPKDVLTGQTFAGKIFDDARATTPTVIATLTCTVVDDPDDEEAVDTYVRVSLAGTLSAPLAARRYDWEIERTDSLGVTHLEIDGTVTVESRGMR